MPRRVLRPSGPAWTGHLRPAVGLVAVEWGGAFVECSKKLTAKQDKVSLEWELHTGGSAAILPKIKAAWPNAKYDIVSGWVVVWQAALAEGWLEPITFDDVPNLRDMPESLFVKDGDGNIVNIPRSLTGEFWGYRSDTAPFEIKTMEDLLDPRLKGQIAIPHPTQGANQHMISLAMARGGDQYNLEPGWEFLKDIAKAGNIGRISVTETDFINSLTTGETSVAIFNLGSFNQVAKNVPITYLTKVPTDKAFVTTLASEGWCLLKTSKRKKEALEFLNWRVGPQNNTDFNACIGEGPTNTKSTPSDAVKHIFFTKEEFAEYAMIPDYAFLSKELDGALKRFEQEIVPLL